MAATNSLNPEWQPQTFPGEDPQLWIWRKLATQYIYELRGQGSNLNQTVQNFNNNVTDAITKVTQQIAAANNSNNNSTAKVPAIFGYSGIMWSNYPPNLWAGYFFVQTDRNALYYSNGSAWIALEGTGTGSFENRWTSLNSHDAGLAWVETSRSNIAGLPPYPYYEWNGANWNFISGEFYRNQANLAVLANSFAPANAANGNDIGARVNVLDFRGQLQWTNANNSNGWALGPDDEDQHGMGPFFGETDRTGSWWHLYDGSNNVTYLKSDGTLGNSNLPNLVSANNVAFLQAGNVNSNINPVVVPIFTGNAAAGSVSAPAFTGDAQNFSTANFTTLLAGSPALVSPASITPTGNISTPAFTGNNVTGTISNNGQPPSITRRPWFRR